MSEVLAQLEKKGGGSFDIATIPAGSCAVLRSGSGIAGYATIGISGAFTRIATGTYNGETFTAIANADGFTTFSARTVSNAVVLGLNDDGTLTPLYAQRLSGVQTINVPTQGYKYLISSFPIGAGGGVDAKLE